MNGSIRDSEVFATYSFIITPATNAAAEPHKTEFEVEFFKTIADKNTTFAMLEVKRGLLMTGGASIRFVERAGWSNAMKYLLTGMKFDSNEAFRMNLVQEIHKSNDLFTRAVELAGLICSASPDAIKEVIKNSRIAQINQNTAISQFDNVQNKLIKGKDFKEGLKSFLEKFRLSGS